MATLTVTTATDVVNSGDGLTSLREAVTLANAATDADTIVFGAGLAGSTLNLTGGELVLSQDVTIDGDIDGDDRADINISGNLTDRIFSISGAGTNVVLLSLNLQDGAKLQRGGAIYMNTAGGSLDIVDMTISGSNSGTRGGALAVLGGDASLTNTLIVGNVATLGAGGLYVRNSGTLSLINTTVTGNTSYGSGGGIAVTNGGTALLENSTIVGNQANIADASSTGGGGIQAISMATVTINNTVVAENLSGTGLTANDLLGGVFNASNSFFGTNVLLNSSSNNILNGGDPLLGALADNGGTTSTMSIETGSALINAGDNALIPAGLGSDANGHARISNATVDIGATEYAIEVTTADDEAAGANLAADLADGTGLSLREAIAHAGVGETIVFDNNLAGSTLTLTLGQLVLTQSVTIDGDTNNDNVADITLSGNNASRVFFVTGVGDVFLKSLDMADGFTNSNGGAILAANAGILAVVDSTISNSLAGVSSGGIIAGFYAGAAVEFQLVNSTVMNNQSLGHAGGVNVGPNAVSATIVNSTIYGNTAATTVGGLVVNQNTFIYNSTIFGNSVDSSSSAAGGIYRGSVPAEIYLSNSVVAGNTSGPGNVLDDIFGSVFIATNSFIGTTETIINDLGGNINGGGDPVLGELLNNGGTVLTLSPLDGSALIGAGLNGALPADKLDIDNDRDTTEDLPLDGRGGLRIVGGTVDIGAVEQIVNETIGGTDGDNNIIGGLGIDDLDGGAGNDTISGGPGADTINGGAGDDVIAGGSGVDTLDGGSGLNDTLDYSGTTTTFDVNLATGVTSLAGETAVNFENINIGAGDNFVVGTSGDNTINTSGGNDSIEGRAGDDIIEGGAGDDIINGGTGTDTASYENASGGVTVDLHTRTTSGADGSDTLISIENVTGSAFDDILRGSAFVGDTIQGGGGNDTIVGRAGIDTMIGGAGDDSYFVQQLGDLVAEMSNEGNDTVRVYFDNYTLADNVEVGRVVGAANILFGNGLDNLLAGSGGADELYGGGGNDTLTGNGGGDTLFGEAGDDRLIGSAGADTLNGGVGNDRLEGNADIDTMNGNDGDDDFFGGGGRDFMTGGLGADRFIFDDADFGGNTFALADRILDFNQLENDSIDLRPTDADTTMAGDQIFTFIAGADFSGSAGELRFIQSGGRTYVQGDTDGDGNSDFMIRLEGLHVLDAGDFLL